MTMQSMSDTVVMPPAALVSSDALCDTESSKTQPALPLSGPTFLDFCASHLGSSVPVTAELASPNLGRAWAEAVVMHWSRLQRMGGLDASQPLYVLDIAPGDASHVACFLPALFSLLQGHGMQGWPVQYVACTSEASQRDVLTQGLANHGVLSPHIEAGRLELGSWNMCTGRPLLLGAKRTPLFGARNPLVVLALGGWSTQAAQLHAVHHGKYFLGHVQEAVNTTDSSDIRGELELQYEWQPNTLAHITHTREANLLSNYCVGVPSAALLLSETALMQIDAIADFSAGRYLLLAADMGVSDERQIRTNGLMPSRLVPSERWMLPVNFHALGQHQQMNGAQVNNCQRSDHGWVLHAACRDDILGVDKNAWQVLLAQLAAAHPDDRERDVTCHSATLEGRGDEALELDYRLRKSGSDPRTLSSHLSRLIDAAMNADSVSAQALRTSLMQAWSATPTVNRGADMGAALAVCLASMAAWADAREVLAQTLFDDEDEQCHLLILKAQVELGTGHAGAALRWAQSALQLQPDNEAAQALVTQIQKKFQTWLAHPWYLHEHMRAGKLCLELLDDSHTDALRYQRRDPQIAEMAQLGELDDDSEQAAGQGADRVDYALMHSDFGFIGVIGFRQLEDMAFFHYWIGADFQGKKLASRALALLTSTLKAGGVRHLFTAVYSDNQRCRRVLERAAFSEIDDHDWNEDAEENFALIYHRCDALATGCAPSPQRWRTFLTYLRQPAPSSA